MLSRAIGGFGLAVLLLGATVVPVAAEGGEGIVHLGAGFTGRPFSLGGDIVLETDGVWNCVRDHGQPDGPGWIGWHLGGSDGGLWREVLWDGGMAAVLRDEFNAGVQFVDFADPAAPVTVGAITGTTYAAGLLHGRLLFLARESLVIVYDVTDPASPAFRFATVLPPETVPRSFCATGGTIYFVASGGVVRALDAADPLAIADLGAVDLGADRVDALAAAPGALYALIATETAPFQHRIDLVTFDISNPAFPLETDRRVLTSGLGARGLSMQRRDTLLLAAENQAATHAFDVSVPTDPLPGFVLPIAAERLVVTQSRLFAVAGEEVQVHTRTAASGAPELLSTRHVLPELRRFSGAGPVLWSQPEKDHSLLIAVDVAIAVEPRLGLEFETGLDGEFVHHGETIVMIDGDDLQVVDVHDPAAPALRGTVRLTSRVSGLSAALGSGVIALEADAARAVDLVDLRDVDHPRQAGRIQDADRPLAVGSGLALVVAGDQVRLHGIADPYQPVDHGPVPVEGTPLAAAIAGPRAYCLTAPPAGFVLSVLDITDTESVRIVATLPLDTPGSLALYGQRLYITGTGSVQIVDIARPGAPEVVAWLETTFPAASRLGVHDDLVVSGTNLSVVRDTTWRPTAVADPPVPPAAPHLSAHPNPFNPRTIITFALPFSGHVTLTVHDLRGRRLASLASGSFPAGTHHLRWSGTDADDRPLPSGTYLLHLQAPTFTSSLTTTLVK